MRYRYIYRPSPDIEICGVIEADTLEDATWKALDTLKELLYLPVHVEQFTIAREKPTRGHIMSTGVDK